MSPNAKPRVAREEKDVRRVSRIPAKTPTNTVRVLYFSHGTFETKMNAVFANADRFYRGQALLNQIDLG